MFDNCQILFLKSCAKLSIVPRQRLHGVLWSENSRISRIALAIILIYIFSSQEQAPEERKDRVKNLTNSRSF